MAKKETVVTAKTAEDYLISGPAPSEPAPSEPASSESAPPAPPAPSESEGLRQRRAFMPRMMLPDSDWINKNVVSRGKGTQVVIGRVWGVATKTYRKSQTLPNGTPNESIVMEGTFQTESYVTGELSEVSTAYFPMAYATKIEAMLLADKTISVIEVDVDLGLEATGKAIPYEWVVIAYRQGEEMAVMKRLRNSRRRPTELVSSVNKPTPALTNGTATA